MHVCMVSPNLPPVQAANALLPTQLAAELAHAGIESTSVSPSTPDDAPAVPDSTIRVARRGTSTLSKSTIGAVVTAGRIAFAIRRAIANSDIVHLHSNGLIVETAAYVAHTLRKPYVITLYGSDVWCHSPVQNRRYGNIVRSASHRVFYSNVLLEFARPLDLAPKPSSVIYAPVARTFHAESEGCRHELRRSLGVGRGHCSSL